jgi:hypothetical protein
VPGGGSLPPAYWPTCSPGARWCRGAALPGGQARMSGSPPQRRSRRCSHSRLTARPGPWRRRPPPVAGVGDAPSARAASLASSAALPRPPASRACPAGGDRRPLRQRVRQPLRHSLRLRGAYPSPRGSGLSVQVKPLRGASRPQKPRPTGPPQGEWSGRAERCASRDLIQRRGRVLGGPSVRAACGGNLSLSWLPLRVVRHLQGDGPRGGEAHEAAARPSTQHLQPSMSSG